MTKQNHLEISYVDKNQTQTNKKNINIYRYRLQKCVKQRFVFCLFQRELRRWRSSWESTSDLPESLVEALRHADTDIFPNIRQLLLVGCVSPIGSSEAERSFSVLRRTKTHLRSTMSEERLAGLSMMAIHHKEALNLSTEHLVEQFVKANPRRLFCQSILFET